MGSGASSRGCVPQNKKEQQLRWQMAKVNGRTIEEIHVNDFGALRIRIGLELGAFARMQEMFAFRTRNCGHFGKYEQRKCFKGFARSSVSIMLNEIPYVIGYSSLLVITFWIQHKFKFRRQRAKLSSKQH